MMTRAVVVFLLFYLVSCTSKDKWEGGMITEEGTYEKGDLTIIVKDHDYSLDYFMLGSKGDTLIKSDRKFSSFQRWALHLDKDQRLWVFSSDIGHACWKPDTIQKKYIKREYFGPIAKDSIPNEVYGTLKQFHPYSSSQE